MHTKLFSWMWGQQDETEKKKTVLGALVRGAAGRALCMLSRKFYLWEPSRTRRKSLLSGCSALKVT